MPNFNGSDISAIVPTYNRASLLRSTIQCLLAQSTPPGEIIVVDDGSTDDTQAAIEQFGTAIRYHRLSNGGAPIARNTGAGLASRPWLWFCDSDDIWHPDYLGAVCTLLNALPRPRFVFGNFRLVQNERWDERTKFDSCPPKFWPSPAAVTAAGPVLAEPLYQRLLQFQPIFHSTLVVARSLFNEIGGYSGRFARTGSEDFEFVLRCSEHVPVGVVHKALVGIRRHPGNYSANQIRNLLGEIDILRYAKAHHALGRLLGVQIEREVARRSVEALELAFAEGRYDLVRTLVQTLSIDRLSHKTRAKIALSAMPAWLRTISIYAATVVNSQHRNIFGTRS